MTEASGLATDNLFHPAGCLTMDAPVSRPLPLRARAEDQRTQPEAGPVPTIVLSPEQRTLVAGIAQSVQVSAKTVIYGQGTHAEMVFLVRKGLVRITHQLEDGRSQVLAFHWPGDPFGLFENDAYLNEATALTDCELERFRLSDLRDLFTKDPQLQSAFLIGAVAELRMNQRHLLLVTHRPILKRVAGFVIECCRQPECYNASTGILTLIMDRSDIADYLGTTVETVSRALGVLENRKLIMRRDARHVHPDLTGLKRLLISPEAEATGRIDIPSLPLSPRCP
ncbi:Crp/Fnr family transcriptional regulator [Acetobacter estunensis]|nr:Crp/Fnr family transcriptional regulator [Acetobacter estunensis]